MELDDHVELRKKLRPSGLTPGQNLGGSEVLQVFVVRDNVNWNARTFQVVPPRAECFIDSEKLLIMDIVVELQSGESSRTESNGTNLIIQASDGDNPRDRIVRCIRLDDYRSVRDPMSEDWS